MQLVQQELLPPGLKYIAASDARPVPHLLEEEGIAGGQKVWAVQATMAQQALQGGEDLVAEGREAASSILVLHVTACSAKLMCMQHTAGAEARAVFAPFW